MSLVVILVNYHFRETLSRMPEHLERGPGGNVDPCNIYTRIHRPGEWSG